MARADLIVCPSLSATQAFNELPLEAPIVVVPFGVDIDEFPWVERDWTGQLSFLHAGVTQFRKGSWMVPEAFVAAFAEDVGGVRLTIASPRASPMFVQLKAEYGNHRSIDFKLGLEESASTIYNTHHIYVSPHLSEGFGLMIPEAMATGMPAIVARCDYGWWIEMSEDYVRVCECLPETSGFWRLPDLDSLVAVMREAYEDREKCALRSQNASAYVQSSLTWDHTCRMLKQRIEEVLDGKESIIDHASVQRRAVAAG
jgi:glycosyltransferase involved in cell wall biosynthesis